MTMRLIRRKLNGLIKETFEDLYGQSGNEFVDMLSSDIRLEFGQVIWSHEIHDGEVHIELDLVELFRQGHSLDDVISYLQDMRYDAHQSSMFVDGGIQVSAAGPFS